MQQPRHASPGSLIAWQPGKATANRKPGNLSGTSCVCVFPCAVGQPNGWPPQGGQMGVQGVVSLEP
eukprot:362025-Chlamydomonas_euryale.AAC.2